MASETPPLHTTNPLDIWNSIPAQLQGIAALGLGLGMAYMVWQRFLKSYRNPTPPQKELMIGDAANIVDLQPIRDLVAIMTESLKQQNLMTMQYQKNDALVSSFVAQVAEFTKVIAASRNSVIEAQNEFIKTLSKDLGGLSLLLENHLLELRQEREEEQDRRELEAARREGYEAGMVEGKKRKPRPRTTKRTPRAV